MTVVTITISDVENTVLGKGAYEAMMKCDPPLTEGTTMKELSAAVKAAIKIMQLLMTDVNKDIIINPPAGFINKIKSH
jgi:hypothetical protein